MTNNEIRKLAKQAGIAQHGLGWTAWEGQLEKFAALVERDAIARNADSNAMAEALEKLCDAADGSDGACYGTLSTSFVRDIAREALSTATPSTKEQA